MFRLRRRERQQHRRLQAQRVGQRGIGAASSVLGIRLWNARAGIAALEFALVAPFLILLLTGAVSFGIGLRVKMEVGNAARSGAAYASSNTFDQARIIAAAQSATALATNVSVVVTKMTASCVSQANGAILPANGAASCAGTGTPPGTYVEVRTQMPYDFILPIPGMDRSTTLHGRAVARIE